jgi:hypothetical protein
MPTHAFGAYTGGDVVLATEDREMVATLVDVSDTIQAHYSDCNDEKIKEELAMEYHTTRRSFDVSVFCRPGDTKEWNDRGDVGLALPTTAISFPRLRLAVPPSAPPASSPLLRAARPSCVVCPVLYLHAPILLQW